ncbi:MAG: hypothetical protein GXY70_02990 [Euryarchaeota archaeon]|nr:hypothetical protein [Euryarchaeota archaeon]
MNAEDEKPTDQRYKTVRLREEDYNKLKEVQSYLVRKGTDALDWEELQRQNIVDIPNKADSEADGALTIGFILGLSTAALAYLLWKSSQNK